MIPINKQLFALKQKHPLLANSLSDFSRHEKRVQGDNLISSHGWGDVKLVGFTGVTSEA
ncbi:hypothetical protein NIES4072_05490 [Nostoc commune NIES-4072]|uniref:Uncharacterized protein n=1 Tax=Nostoc commune NIES-4072 TaxID=2005467 RepID=A0A2R5FKX9_NOSCO|nr:hypothetical protein NIES4070_21330 [Nostoc commune HK-02]GBG16903.1 hypothetical protein NIES4072_05490 [Nostoc commune NIES-4072]